MSEKLKLLDRLSSETGILLGLIGLFTGLLGTGLSFWEFPSIGLWLCGVGIAIGFLGVALHFALNWRTIFRVDR